MQKFKHCDETFEIASQLAEHVRWKHQDNTQSGDKIRSSLDERFGELKDHIKICEKCKQPYTVTGRFKTKVVQESRFCSRSCANSVGGNAKSARMIDTGDASYRTICFSQHEKRCVICGENKIVAVHHYDGDRTNNDPMNLIPLCPTHHQYVHSQYVDEVMDKINEYVGAWEC